jgi:SPP1 family predicted phage head-tail adaptor
MNIQRFYKDDVILYTVTEGISSITGENVKTNSAGDSIKGKVRPLTQFERYSQNKNNYDVTHRLYTWFSTLYSNIDRAEYNGEVYEIISISNPFEKNEFLQIDMRLIK